jgi:hypothetical protein
VKGGSRTEEGGSSGFVGRSKLELIYIDQYTAVGKTVALGKLASIVTKLRPKELM